MTVISEQMRLFNCFYKLLLHKIETRLILTESMQSEIEYIIVLNTNSKLE